MADLTGSPRPGRGHLVAPVAGFPAFVLAILLDEHMPARLVSLAKLVEKGHLPPSRLTATRETWAAIRAAGEEWKHSASAGGSTEALPAEMPSRSSQEIDTATAADLLRVTESRVRQLARSGDIAARKVGGVWLVDRSEIEMRRAA
ncbi:helix-turn-helix domain-containing protein [Dactylosporangium sp. CA-152071]|uniref:helix-turn-helix domain-containing protein n=1 Tax=Dactylosporangium sp. CA-152071 TaxID=3239933 RepID=UPI003D8B4D3E